jgi:predicted RNase H-like HicB family nuclease
VNFDDLARSVRDRLGPPVLLVPVGGRIYTAVLTRDPAVGGYTVTVPELPGCVTEADTLDEARTMAAEVIGLWLEAKRGPTPALT